MAKTSRTVVGIEPGSVLRGMSRELLRASGLQEEAALLGFEPNVETLSATVSSLISRVLLSRCLSPTRHFWWMPNSGANDLSLVTSSGPMHVYHAARRIFDSASTGTDNNVV
ncbi:hypothetical protein M407DRAFT_137114 [Tulasnella calospora MUT 4182]|uniref:Uncharacterized protein n=1 Tax=Tulasnella calospora MUT 4182 TaxID=1051891 RepID=A0A0C3LG86_9AGAM|nr:hypothetical protein M407DRAFT_137114 [Tulasnella calospora MUT 4182]